MPENYFTNFHQQILLSIHKNFTSQLPSNKNNPYQIPENYFNSFADKVLALAKNNHNNTKNITEELSQIAPTLNIISKKQVYTIPANYFNDSNNVVSKIKNKPSTKIINIRKWVVYAAAAILTGFTVVGVINFLQPTNNVNIKSAIANVSDDELNDFLNDNKSATYAAVNENEEIADLFQGTATDDIVFYLDEVSKID